MNHFLRILLKNISAIIAATTLTFVCLRLLPGDAVVTTLVDSGASAAEIEARRASFYLDEPMIIQFIRYLEGIVRLDFGISLLDGQPVSQKIAQQWFYTVPLAAGSLAFSVLIGIVLGYSGSSFAGKSWLRTAADSVTAIVQSIPVYWLGTLVIIVFSVWLNWFPSSGASGIESLVLPVITLGFLASGSIARTFRTAIEGEKSAAYVTTAVAKGLPDKVIFSTHVLRNALPPVIGAIMVNAGFLLSGTVLVETVFNRPGLGRLLLDSVVRGDLPVVQGIVILSAALYAALLTMGELVNYLLDPRFRVVRL